MSLGSRLATMFWVWYCLAAAMCLAFPQGRVFTGAIGMSIFWGLLLKFHKTLQERVERIPGPLGVRFLVVGILTTDVVMENLAINFHGDLHPNLALNSLLWLGGCLAWLAGWWIVSRFYWFEASEVFFIAGIMGMLVEQNGMVAKLLVSGQWFPAIVSATILVPVYGGAVAPTFLLLRRVPSESMRRPGIVGFFVALFLPMGTFYAGGALWIAVARAGIARLQL